MTDGPAEQFRSYLLSLGLPLDSDAELGDTPERFTELLKTLFAGLDEDPPKLSTFAVPESSAPPGPVIIAATPFHSMCAHHLLPFFGTIDVAYLPGHRMIGFGSIGRVIDHFARRPQVQERLIAQIADYLQVTLRPQGLLIRLRARQLCMEMRGTAKRGELVSLAARGCLREGSMRQELLAQFQRADVSL